MHRRRTATAVLAVLLVTVSACSQEAPAALPAAPAGAAAPGDVATGAPALPSAVPAAPPSAPADAGQEPSPAPPAKPSYDVVAAQKTLAALGYYLGAADGRRGTAFRSAVLAFQKVQGLGADGTVGPATLRALASPRKPVLKASSPSNRVEVDLTRQVLYVVKGGAVKRILPVSSGNGRTYEQKDGSDARALTPVGWYRVQRRVVGVREADLGTLYDPQYFYRGWAIHGSNSVPAVPASHGCVRVTRADATWLLTELSVGMSVYLYGGTHVFSAGSSAPGTDSPTGDTAADTAPSPAPSPKPTRAPAPAPASASPRPKATTSAPAPTPTAARPSPSPSAR